MPEAAENLEVQGFVGLGFVGLGFRDLGLRVSGVRGDSKIQKLKPRQQR